MFKNKVWAPLIIFILLMVAGIVISNGYFINQWQQNRLDADPATAEDMDDLPIPKVDVDLKTDDVEQEVKVGS